MGYDIHITRRQRWADTGAPEITLSEWQAIVDSDPELESQASLPPPIRDDVMMFDPSCNAIRVVLFAEWQTMVNTNPDSKQAAHDPAETEQNTCALMFDPSRHSVRVFWYSEGSIFVTKPCKAVLMKMLDVAHRLNARVIGEADEIYAPDGKPSHVSHFDVRDDW